MERLHMQGNYQILHAKSSRTTSIKRVSPRTVKSLKGLVVLITFVQLQVYSNYYGVSCLSCNVLRSQSPWEIWITYSVLAGGLLAKTISGKSIWTNHVNHFPAMISWKSQEVNSTSDFGNINGTPTGSTSSTADLASNGTINLRTNESSIANRPHEPWRYRRLKSDKEKLRLELLKQIKSLDHMKCFPKVLCGLSVDSSKSSSGIDPDVVKSYIQLMRSAKPEDDSSEEGRPARKNTKDALTLFLMKSGIIRRKSHKPDSGENSGSTSTSDEEEYEDTRSQEEVEEPLEPGTPQFKSAFERNREQLENILLSKRILETGNHNYWNKSHPNIKHEHINPNHFPSVLYMNPASMSKRKPSTGERYSTSTSKTESEVSPWVPWVSFSLGTDSFEKDPFFTPGTKGPNESFPANQKHKNRQNDFDQMVYLMRLKQAVDRRMKKTALNKRQGLPSDLNRRARDLKEDEMVIYATAVEIGQKLKDTKQCDYLYNGCPVPYLDIIKIISSIRKEIKQDYETVDALSQEMFGNDNTTPAPKRKQLTRKPKVKKPTPKPIKRQQTSQSQPNNAQKSGQTPMTKISHTLPNGEKVEINVQVSGNGKDDLSIEPVSEEQPEYEEELPAEEEVEEEVQNDSENTSYLTDIFQQVEKIPEVEVEEEPALSASYELDDELPEDVRKPTPLEIFNKISLSATDNPVEVTTTTTEVTTTTTWSTTTKPLSTTTKQLSTTPKRPTTSTKKPKTIKTTTKQPSTTTEPLTATTKRSRKTSTTKRTTRRPTTSRTKPTKKPTVKLRTTAKPKRNKRPTRRPYKVTTKAPVSTNRPSRRPTRTSTLRPPRRTTKKPVLPIPNKRKKPGHLTPAGSKKATTRATTKSPIDTDEESIFEDDSEFFVTIPSSAKPKSTTPRPKRSSTLSPKSTTESALAMFTTTSNFMLEYIEKDLSTTDRLNKPSLSSLAPVINRYSVSKKTKPASGLSNSNATVFSIEKNLAGTEMVSISSLESDSTEISFFNPQETGTLIISREDPGKDITTTVEPKLFSNTGDGSGKRKINYKNAKLPHLVLMTASALENPSIGLSQSSVTITGNRRRPKPSPKPHYSLSSKKTGNKTSSSVEFPPPLIYIPGTRTESAENIPWSPHQ